MQKKIIGLLVWIGLVFAPFYLLLSFTFLDINLFSWHPLGRFILAATLMFIGAMSKGVDAVTKLSKAAHGYFKVD